ncbi:BHLH domain-containing protein [Psidium guajava]|nr:BHLH domain-containing protein [Psidium guajava]
MEITTMRGLPDMGMEDSGFINPWQMHSFDELNPLPLAAALGEHMQGFFPQPSINYKASVDASNSVNSRLVKQLKTNSWDSCRVDPVSIPQSFAPSNVLSFVASNSTNQSSVVKPKEEAIGSKSTGNASADMLFPQGSFGNQNYVLKACHGGKRVSTDNRLSQTQDHIMAERKRREKLSQRFIALSALVPGLKKMDKASVLGDAIKYLKQLQERVKILEEQTRKRSMESVVFVKKSQVFDDGMNSSTDENFSSGPCDELLPEVEARICDNDVLIKVHCEKSKGVLEKILGEVEKLHLTIVNSSFMTFGTSAVDVTILAQMDAEFCMPMRDLVKNLRTAFKSFM